MFFIEVEENNMYVAKPFLNNNKDMKEFDCIQDAIKYLEQVTGYEMSF